MFACLHTAENTEALFACACEFSPLVERTAADTVVLDVSGLDRMFGSPGEIAAALARRAAARGVKARVALASNPDTAVCVARAFSGIHVVPYGDEAKYLEEIPLALLAPCVEMLETLERWGIRTCRQLAVLPVAGIAERLGPEGLRLRNLARGAINRPLVPFEAPPRFEEEMELEYPLELLEPLSFLLARLLGEICARLETRGLATNELRLRLGLEGGGEHARSLRLPVPMRDHRAFLKLLQLDLASHPPGAAVTRVGIAAEPVEPRVAQHGLFVPLAPEPEKLELTLARVANLVGEENAGSPELVDTHRPGAFRMRKFGLAPATPAVERGAVHLAFRVYRPPRPAHVAAASGRPEHVHAQGIRGKVISAAGPWRTSGDWWTRDPWARDEWDVALSDGALYRIYCEESNGCWFVGGELRLMYVELHARSAFSFLRGASLPEELAAACAGADMPAMALLDRDGVYGAPRFHMAAKKLGIRAHIGAEITCTDGRTYPLLAENRAGYRNLCRLITRMKLRAGKGEGAATPDEIAEYAGGLICLTRHPDERLADIFRGRLYAELQRHLHRDEEARNQAIVEAARRLRIPLVASNGVSHATPRQREVLDVLTCVREKATLETAGRLLSRNAERRLKTAAEMTRLFADLPEAIANTGEISARLDFSLADLGYEFPRYPVPPGETMASFLGKRAREGARARYRPYHLKAQKQIEHELALIEKLNLAGYFLIVWDLVNFCRDRGILVQGRGSAANSAVCYALGITAVDPVGMELLFERFLSEERGEWPDIDLDLPSGERRERVIQYVYERYGKLGAAMTANVITYRGRSAAREVGKALGFEVATLDRLSGLVRGWEWKDPKDSAERQFREAGLDLANPRIRKFFEIYQAVQDLPRHLGQHSGGMVICQGQLDAVTPLEPAAMPGRVVVQWDKEDCADMGIVKVDLLGLGMMAVLEESLALIREAYGEEVDLAHLPQDDPAVYSALQQADTIGMFQVESRAQMSCLPRHRPEKFYDLVVQVALIRPGPIVGNMVNPYLQRRQGREPVDYMHPSLEPVLKRTLGVPLFQEQLLRMAMTVAGFSGGEAEELRRAMGFKRSEKRMREVEVKLRRGMARNGITGDVQDRIIQSIASFALYGFPESHSASFALLAYASAYLKCHYLAAFLAALLNNQPMGFYAPSILVKDAQRHGLRVLPVDVSVSEWLCTVEPCDAATRRRGDTATDLCLRLGFRYVRGLREQAARAIVLERARAPFSSVDDLALRVPELRKDELNMLAEVGALNSLRRIHRRDALWQAERAVRPVGPLLEHLEETEAVSPLAPMNAEERLSADFYGTGLTVGRHPMAHRRAEMNALGVSRAAELTRIPNRRSVRVAGSVIVRQRPGTAKGFVFLSMEDETGIMNVIVTPDLFERNRLVLVSHPFLLIEGVLQNQDGVVSVKARRIEALPATAAVPSHDFH